MVCSFFLGGVCGGFCVVYGGFFGYLGDRIVFFGVFLGDSFMIHDFQGYV